jgi:RNA polymerase sigma-70 factor (ECF subfamily)
MVTGATRGDPGAMRDLLVSVAPIVARTARRVMGRHHPDVEDVAQQALSAFVERLPTFRNESSITHFAERITVYRALTARRDAAVRGRFIVADGDLMDAVADDMVARSAEGEAADSACRRLLLRALDAIAPPQAEALALHFLFDYTVSEIAEAAGVAEETVRSRLRLGKQALRALIEREPSLAALREHLT